MIIEKGTGVTLFAAAAVLCAPIGALPATEQQAAIEHAVARADAPIVLYATGAGLDRPLAAAYGLADPAMSRALTVDTPFRVASNTKTFVAATLLRMQEAGLIDIDAPIGPLLDPEFVAILENDGYEPSRITVRQLMSHSAGLYDHGGDARYVAAMLSTPKREWKRIDQLRLMTEYADPQGKPGTRFLYSDTGYILLGDIIERRTGKPLAIVVREALRFRELGLETSWWENDEEAPATAPPRARQHIDGRDVSSVHASFDLYGGGGLVMSAKDLATFFAALFEKRVFDDPATLREMIAAAGHEGGDRYRLGIFAQKTPGGEVYWHSGFWGTAVYYDPRRKVAAAAYTTRQEMFRTQALPLLQSVVGIRPDHCTSAATPR